VGSHRRERNPARCALVVVGGEAMVINNDDGVVDDVPGITASTRVRLATSETSCGGGEWRPEIETARVSMRRAQRCKNSNDLMHQGLHQREGRRMVQEREGAEMLHFTGICEDWQLPCGASARNLCGLTASLRGGKERDERGERGL
jgi:hypothetical protein